MVYMLRHPTIEWSCKKKNKHIVEVAGALMHEKELTKYDWPEYVHTALYITNRTPTVVIHGMMPEEMLQGRSLIFHTVKYLDALPRYIYQMS